VSVDTFDRRWYNAAYFDYLATLQNNKLNLRRVLIMTKDELLAKVKETIIDQLGADEGDITMEANFREDLEADSLDLVELIMAFEEEFDVEISDEEAQKITTVGEAVNYLYEHSV
jgi:acyl carrier protein